MEEEKGNSMHVNILLPRIKHHQLHTRTQKRTLHHQDARNALTYNLKIHIEQAAAQPVQPDVGKNKRAGDEKGNALCMSAHYSLASSITNCTRAHARALFIINTHATRLLTNYRSRSSKLQHRKNKRAERGGWRRTREMPCTSISLLPRIKHHQLHARTRTHTLHHQHANSVPTSAHLDGERGFYSKRKKSTNSAVTRPTANKFTYTHLHTPRLLTHVTSGSPL